MNILITGASSGIGAALAEGYAQQGNTLIVVGRNVARLDAVAEICRAKGAVVIAGYVDVTDKEKLAQFMLKVDAEHPIDLAIANAGISAGSMDGELLYRADEVFEVNLRGVLNTIHPIIPRMVNRGKGQIALMSSLASIRALPSAAAYSASKAAVRFYGDALRGELKPFGVDVSVITPGWIATPLTEKNDFPMPFLMSSPRAAARIIHSLARKKSRIAFPRKLYLPLRILDALPIFVSDPLFARMPKKRHKP